MIVAGVSPDQLGNPTPCPDYDVATLIDHVIGASWLGVALGRGESPAGGEFPHIELADAPDQLRRAGQAAEAAWSDDARLAATVTMPWGETYTGATLVDLHVTELAAHTWDLAASTGQLDRLDPGLAPNALEAARGDAQARVPQQRRQSLWRRGRNATRRYRLGAIRGVHGPSASQIARFRTVVKRPWFTPATAATCSSALGSRPPSKIIPRISRD
jgi:uncharacterized protein (TIGR03086 family)